jgi:membrane glycosyltransferase
MARTTRKYSKKASAKVGRVMKERKAGTLKSGRSGRTVRSRKQAIAIGLSEARREGDKVPKKASKASAKKTAKKTSSKKRKAKKG